MLKDTQIVVAKYVESVSWLGGLNQDIRPIIYNKCGSSLPGMIDLPNVGREAHTYLHHIISNYDRLPNYLVFCQANPFDHEPSFIHKVNDPELYRHADIEGFVGLCPRCTEGPHAIDDPRHPVGLPMYYWFDLLFEHRIFRNDRYNSFYGAQFVTTRDRVRCRPIEFYRFLLSLVSTDINPMEAYIYERLWPFIFDPKFVLSAKINSLIRLLT